MQFRRNNFDVTNTVDVTSPEAVGNAIAGIYLGLYPDADPALLLHATNDVAAMFRGNHPDFAACDTPYHDLQHTLDVTLAATRLLDGYERAPDREYPLGKELFKIGVLAALFHDSGYLKKRDCEDGMHGAEFTLTHVSRGEALFRRYLHANGLSGYADRAPQLLHFTGYEIPVDHIQIVSPVYRIMGNLIATADMLAQMSDRCYLEKCHDRLYLEFDLGNVARQRDKEGNEKVVFASAKDLVLKTPNFYAGAKKRMEETLQGVYRYSEYHFGGHNPYLEIAEKNIRFVDFISANNADIGLLQRTPPQTPGSEQALADAAERRKFVEDRRMQRNDRRQNLTSDYPEALDRRMNGRDRRKSSS